ncbi:three-Cys-motif partner protein TcmP [Rhizobium sp. CB3090]|uniref:three-Cys-motif partner protein TcmP n=1 Tax=Rhizobium sp. CB3090 TaxID=3039156 RepID=UPI0024B1C16B|nr:three-Cys-motif partner protein TcmP [Rhizobium sp. CB3090]WFU09175.1 three-Cys-motif partner protein TcmP [Rhizobium sp. CB3090]
MAHKYGGPWSEVKLDAVEYYLQCYSNALTPRRMDIWYIDAYAGSGDREAEREIGGLLEGAPLETVIETLDGSARRALKIDPPFKHFVFIEKDPIRAKQLAEVKNDFPSVEIEVLQGDANSELLKLISKEPWTRKAKSFSRGVVFLDPFSMQVDWSTLRALAATECLDVWYFFNVQAVTRQLAHDFGGVGNKATTLDRVLSPRWRELYAITPEEPSKQSDMFADTIPLEKKEPSAKRTISKAQIDQWFKGLMTEEFAFVSDPLPIITPHSGHTFSLFLAVANRRRKATELAEKFVSYVNKNFGPKSASRRKSGR